MVKSHPSRQKLRLQHRLQLHHHLTPRTTRLVFHHHRLHLYHQEAVRHLLRTMHSIPSKPLVRPLPLLRTTNASAPILYPKPSRNLTTPKQHQPPQTLPSALVNSYNNPTVAVQKNGPEPANTAASSKSAARPTQTRERVRAVKNRDEYASSRSRHESA